MQRGNDALFRPFFERPLSSGERVGLVKEESAFAQLCRALPLARPAQYVGSFPRWPRRARCIVSDRSEDLLCLEKG